MTRWTLHYSREVTAFLRSLGEEGSELREKIRELATEPKPDFCRRIPERQDYYEFEALGYWIGYQLVSDSRVVRVVLIEETF